MYRSLACRRPHSAADRRSRDLFPQVRNPATFPLSPSTHAGFPAWGPGLSNKDDVMSNATRREFLQSSSLAALGTAATLALAPRVHAAGGDSLKVGLIGC